jgi:hypothetical protein
MFTEGIPLNITDPEVPKLAPLIVTVVPMEPDDGDTAVIEGVVPDVILWVSALLTL